jgi:hypothetical protein
MTTKYVGLSATPVSDAVWTSAAESVTVMVSAAGPVVWLLFGWNATKNVQVPPPAGTIFPVQLSVPPPRAKPAENPVIASAFVGPVPPLVTA